MKGKESLEYAQTLNNIGGTYANQGKLNEAFEYYNRALSIYEKVSGKKSVGYANNLNRIVFVYKNQAKLSQSL